MALRLKGSYGLALLFTTGLIGWMATGETVFSGQANENAAPPPALRNEAVATALTRVAVKDFAAQPRQAVLTVRGRTEADTKVTVRSETSAIMRERFVEKGQWVTKGTVLCVLDTGSRQARVAQAEAALAQAEFDLKAKSTLRKKGYASETQITALKATRDAALASVKDARLEMERVTIKAPIDGFVQGPIAEVGDQLKIGDSCAVLMDPKPMLVIGQVSERDIQRVTEGTKASVTLVTGEDVSGKVRYVATASDIETRTFRVEVELDSGEKNLRDGVTAVAHLQLPPMPAHLMSPAHLTLDDNGDVGVMVVDGNTARFTKVAILHNDQNGVWVAGLPEKATVVIVGQEYVKDGQAIEAVSEADYKVAAAKKAEDATKERTQ